MQNKKYIYIYTTTTYGAYDNPVRVIMLTLMVKDGSVYSLHDDGEYPMWLTPNQLLRITMSLEEVVKCVASDAIMTACIYYENDEQKAHIIKKIQAAVKQSKINHYKFLYGRDDI